MIMQFSPYKNTVAAYFYFLLYKIHP